ncbi:DUF1236 domain-containing protein [Aurantimonas sp. VKM B-3413]|uniref:DUF1236 domain-containing protein n=1 Tax=Aurantimonas sp. VKM B-3413 TaxID=2779401 RepID=UPI001E5592FF|nr:DUF1236 domain-containing protein [Aurantimonas sp. VKM B-3413]MCB8840782.1 DUF1236 domain-containing protein [Aurantimonas sp. VKM B-3413]
MMHRTARFAAALLAALSLAPAAFAADEKVNVLQYALAHPTDNASLKNSPNLGDSVPPAVKLQQPPGSSSFAYFYYAGQPIIVDLKTRSIVRIGG